MIVYVLMILMAQDADKSTMVTGNVMVFKTESACKQQAGITKAKLKKEFNAVYTECLQNVVQ